MEDERLGKTNPLSASKTHWGEDSKCNSILTEFAANKGGKLIPFRENGGFYFRLVTAKRLWFAACQEIFSLPRF